jgi:hypothetical protein
MAGVFINFRVGDGEDRAIVLDMALGAAFGPDLVFRSSRSIPVGTDYRPALLAGVRRSSVMLVSVRVGLPIIAIGGGLVREHTVELLS